MSIDTTVPELRYKEYSYAWEEKQLNQEVELFSGLTYSPKDIRKDGVFVIRSSNVKNGQLVQADNVYVAPEVVNCNNVEKGDIVVVVRNGSRSLIGKHAQVNSYMDNTVIGAFMTGVRGKQPEFINALFDTNQFTAQVDKNLGATINQITNGSFNSMAFKFPEDLEQAQIGTTFQKLDTLINQHQQKHDKLSNVKKAMLEKMFPKQGETIPEVRFKKFCGEWVESSVAEEAIITTGFPFDSADFSESSDLLVITNSNIQNNSSTVDGKIGNRIASKKVTLLNQYRLNSGDILVTMDGSVGRTAKVVESNQILAQRVGRLVARKDIEFLYQSLNTGRFLESMTTISHGGTIKHISLSEIGSYLLQIPKDIEEQVKIGEYFKKLDNLITQHQQQITKLKNIKQACLSKMFV
ncbi:type I restriction enzyme, S subunit [Pseudoalteromonas sp. BSi20311]|uniref:restriction endonuclease subunit S n=1 Tax=Pseudoalteromonas sp. BSi20311 TaxID=383911 RepID=UPI00023186E4|nr:restriction endonuclease subunit S [Pseudoalteromonas sp. BSi20311]GAA62413.1 type I restriction enzyme, S subunit [Pseudoalteromonas sp. BSi20311]